VRYAWLLLLLSGCRHEPKIRAVARVAIPVSDVARETKFFTEVLDFEKTEDLELDGVHVVRVRLGREIVELREYASHGRPIPADSQSDDRWFQHVAVVVSDMPRAVERLRAAHVQEISRGPQRLPDWNPNAGGIEAMYFRDPDGHALEIIHFPKGKGDPRWQVGTGVFLGIDHTAIASGDTEKSLTFYRDRLGMKIAGTSDNYGPEQEALNAVPGAHLRITALRAADGPGVELLEYLAPRRGRPYPDTQPSDLWSWSTVMVGTTPAKLRDPDGHQLEIVE
jgi:catechol 2,3-dioxygenase-like lactoylglutathione lyase family enzyme